ncbi:unnamed protein product [Cercopithifilaria johnstoni]|uniref:Uncharacterized protein n=1 Tax=Cercopithifilaria johnstoni TaxID=2874296 RepID=A0A8J2PZX6_9BILA|nr:unnamed protein product [Cercopithifilaria johnstoni]
MVMICGSDYDDSSDDSNHRGDGYNSGDGDSDDGESGSDYGDDGSDNDDYDDDSNRGSRIVVIMAIMIVIDGGIKEY